MQALIFPLAQAAHLLTACFRFRPTHFKIIALDVQMYILGHQQKKRTEAEEGSSRRGDNEEEEDKTKTNRQEFEIEIVVLKIVVR